MFFATVKTKLIKQKRSKRGKLSMKRRVRRYSCVGYSRNILDIKLIKLHSCMKG